MSNILTAVTDFIGGSLFKEVRGVIKDYFPPDLSPVQKAELEIKLNDMLHEKEIKANAILNDAAKQLDKRIAEQEGTASDLKTIWGLGHIVIFMRGVQRPLWGFATLYMDNQWFFKTHDFDEQQQTAMILINVLVLGFLFGERTIKNLEPLIIKVFAKGN